MIVGCQSVCSGCGGHIRVGKLSDLSDEDGEGYAVMLREIC